MTSSQEIIDSISKYANTHKFLEKLLDLFKIELGLRPILGTEIEFYYLLKSENLPDIIMKSFSHIKKEKGEGQFEIDIYPKEHFMDNLEDVRHAKTILTNIDFISLDAKPLPDDYGNSMHFHLNFIDNNNRNIFDSRELIEQAAKSLCHFTEQHFLAFASQPDDYKRFDAKFMAPTHICFGGNNRSASIRIPEVLPRRIEHRICNPRTDEYLALYLILYSIYYGFKFPDQINNYNKIYGNAYDQQYDLLPLPRDINEAESKFQFPEI